MALKPTSKSCSIQPFQIGSDHSEIDLLTINFRADNLASAQAQFYATNNAFVWRLLKGDELGWEMIGPRPAGRAWTRVEDKQLQALFDSGMEAPAIAQKMKRTIGAIRTRNSHLKKPRKPTPASS